MRCPKCTSIEDKVIDSRIARDGNSIRRRRECLECGHRFTTNEEFVRDSLAVVKRDGRTEPSTAKRSSPPSAPRATNARSTASRSPCWWRT